MDLRVLGALSQMPSATADSASWARVASVCWHCLKSSKSALQRCAKCKTVCYCDSTCQEAHWSSHRIVCRSVVALSDATTDAVYEALRECRTKFRRRKAKLTDLCAPEANTDAQWSAAVVETDGSTWGVQASDENGMRDALESALEGRWFKGDFGDAECCVFSLPISSGPINVFGSLLAGTLVFGRAVVTKPELAHAFSFSMQSPGDLATSPKPRVRKEEVLPAWAKNSPMSNDDLKSEDVPAALLANWSESKRFAVGALLGAALKRTSSPLARGMCFHGGRARAETLFGLAHACAGDATVLSEDAGDVHNVRVAAQTTEDGQPLVAVFIVGCRDPLATARAFFVEQSERGVMTPPILYLACAAPLSKKRREALLRLDVYCLRARDNMKDSSSSESVSITACANFLRSAHAAALKRIEADQSSSTSSKN